MSDIDHEQMEANRRAVAMLESITEKLRTGQYRAIGYESFAESIEGVSADGQSLTWTPTGAVAFTIRYLHIA